MGSPAPLFDIGGFNVLQEESMTEAARLGVIVPSVNIVVEEWYPRVVPGGVSVHFARMLIADANSSERIIAMDREDGRRAISQIASCRPHAVAYGCTASRGPDLSPAQRVTRRGAANFDPICDARFSKAVIA
jgi:hypothetical protein